MTTQTTLPQVTSADVERLVRFDRNGARVLSVYLDLEPERQVTRAYRIAFEDLIKTAREGLDKDRRPELEVEAARVQAWLDKERPNGLGLAIYSATPAGLWQVYALPVPVRDRASFEEHPLVLPLLGVLEDYERYAVALVDKETARLFTIFEGAIERVESFSDDVPGKHDQGGPAQARLQRHHEDHVLRHVKRVAQRLSDLLRRRSFDRLVLAGPDEATTAVGDHLPHELGRRLVATVPAEMFATDAEILRMTLEIEQRVEREREMDTVTAVIDAWRAGGAGACGMSPTLEAVWLRQVRLLVIADGLSAKGSECPVDGRLYPDENGPCPMCGAERVPVGDIFDRAAQLTLEQDGDVEIVHETAGTRLGDECDGLGALLRFVLHA
jgi:peptide chain release factor subunit 1